MKKIKLNGWQTVHQTWWRISVVSFLLLVTGLVLGERGRSQTAACSYGIDIGFGVILSTSCGALRSIPHPSPPDLPPLVLPDAYE